jgi:hypothetical protein
MNLMSKKAPAKSTAKASVSDDTCVALARVALLEVTGSDTFDDAPQVTHEGESVSVSYPSTQPGYPGWRWSVSVSSVPGVEPSVLEVGLLPAEGALVAPDWVPWADRLEEYLLHEKELKNQETEDADEDEDEDDGFELDDDVDGVDIDQLDLDLDPAPLEVPEEPDDLFDHVELEEPDPLDP